MPEHYLERGPSAGGAPVDAINTPSANFVYVDGLTDEVVVGSGVSGATGNTIASLGATQAFTNKTLASPTLTGAIGVSGASIAGALGATGVTMSGPTIAGATLTGAIGASGASIAGAIGATGVTFAGPLLSAPFMTGAIGATGATLTIGTIGASIFISNGVQGATGGTFATGTFGIVVKNGIITAFT